ncbi:MAG: c-type cytochrome [Alphaproteobacteria bacterium]
MRLPIMVTALVLAGAPAFAQAPEGALLAGACQGCHGVTGEGGHGIPSIKQTQTREDFIKMMRAFRANEVPNTVMGRITRGYTDAEVAALAAHFARNQ